MELIDKREFENIKPSEIFEPSSMNYEVTDKEFSEMLDDMKNPVKAQQYLAVKIKIFLDARMDFEIKDKGFLSDHTRRWVDQFNKILDSIQKSLYGDKSVNLHVHNVTHSAIAAKIRGV